MRIFLIVLDSVGIGEAPDAAAYNDVGSATLQHTADAVGGLTLPNLTRMGLGNIPGLLPATAAITGVPSVENACADFGAMQERSQGKDTITGHWEIAGLKIDPGFHVFPTAHPSFPEEITTPFIERTGHPILGNKHGSGTAIVAELGEQALREKAFIVYTSADSVFQIAAHTDAIPLDELYRACEIARELCDPYRVGRVIARPFNGKPGAFERTKDRVDFAFKADEPTILERLKKADIPVYAVGKIEDIFAHRGITESWHTNNNAESQAQMLEIAQTRDRGFVFANFIDFDMLYGHRRDPEGYAECLRQTDAWFDTFLPLMRENDRLIITADHGNDPTFAGTDHTREYVPLIVHQTGQASGKSLGIRDGFYDIAQSVADAFGIEPTTRGASFFS